MRILSGMLMLALIGGQVAPNAQTEKTDKPATLDYACIAATGEKIPHPGSKQTYIVKESEKESEKESGKEAGKEAGKESEKAVTVPLNMVYVPAGEFTMGYQSSAHKVMLDGYCIGKYLVTNAEYKEFVDATGHRPPQRYWKGGTFPKGKENHPVLWVSWNDAQQYCQWVSKQTGWTVTLPTEAQFERAARGPMNYYYPWGNDRNIRNCNYNAVCAAKYGLTVTANGDVVGWHPGFTETDTYRQLVDNGGYTTAVGSYPQGKSGFGAYDMAGNAYEWCSDWYKRDYWTLKGADKNPQGPTEQEADTRTEPMYTGKCKVLRGGSWYGHFGSCCSATRGEVRNPRNGYHSVGFRIVAMMPEAKLSETKVPEAKVPEAK